MHHLHTVRETIHLATFLQPDDIFRITIKCNNAASVAYQSCSPQSDGADMSADIINNRTLLDDIGNCFLHCELMPAAPVTCFFWKMDASPHPARQPRLYPNQGLEFR